MMHVSINENIPKRCSLYSRRSLRSHLDLTRYRSKVNLIWSNANAINNTRAFVRLLGWQSVSRHCYGDAMDRNMSFLTRVHGCNGASESTSKQMTWLVWIRRLFDESSASLWWRRRMWGNNFILGIFLNELGIEGFDAKSGQFHFFYN